MFRVTALCIVAWSNSIGTARAETPATAEDVARAEAYAAQGFDAYARGDYWAAVTLYRKALSAASSADILYNLARIYDLKLKDRAASIEYYSRYTHDTGADPERLRAANERLAQLRELDKVAREPVGSSSAAGRVEHRAQAQPQATRTKPAAASAGGITTAQTIGLVTGGLGVVGVGLGVGFGLAAKSHADDAHAACDGNACRTQQGVDAAHVASRAATISTVAFIAGAALAVTGASLLLWGGRSEHRAESARAAVAPYLAPAAAGMVVTGRW
jgi:tetratricopeptide (TPR) repeat protein